MASQENEPRRVGTIWMQDLDQPLPAVKPLVAATFRVAGPKSAAELATAMGGQDLAEILKRFETGRHCFAAFVGSQLVTYGWVSLKEERIGELGLQVRLLPGEAYIWDCATLPAFRRFHLYTALLIFILRELRAGRLCHAWIGANMENLASHRGIDKAGFRRVADLLVTCKLDQRLAWIEDYPGVPESLVAETRRVFLDDRHQVWLDSSSPAPR